MFPAENGVLVNVNVLFQLAVKLTKLTGELEEEKQLNRCLRDNQSTWQSRVSELEDGVAKKDIVSIGFCHVLRSICWLLVEIYV